MDIPQTIFYQGADHPITAIGANAFAGCTALTSFSLQCVTPPTLADGAFTGIPDGCTFSCPPAALDA
jgi:hypothetical protein